MTELHEIAAESSTALDEPLLLKLQTELEETDWSDWRCERPTIFRVHQKLKKVDSEAYEPKIISFGPYHRGEKHLAAMERLKRLYLKNFLARNPEVRIEDYVREIRLVEMRARSAYFEEIKMSRDEFVEMMLLDGCFILELLLAQYDCENNEGTTAVDQFEDPIWSTSWAQVEVIHDMLMLENQLPFFLLEILFNLSDPSRQFCDLAMQPLSSLYMYLIVPNYEPSDFDYFADITEIVGTSKPYHILHLLYIMVTNRNPPEEDIILPIPEPLEDLTTKEKSCLPTEFICSNIKKMKRLFRSNSCFLFLAKVSNMIFIVVGKILGVLSFSFKYDFQICCCGTRKGSRIEERIPSATKLKDAGVKIR